MTSRLEKLFADGGVDRVGIDEWLRWAANPCSDDKSNEELVFLALPVIQRNSVWKPNQVIELWDSLLRGMPIGSMLVCKCGKGTDARHIGSDKPELVKVPEGGGLELVDGHQRTLAMLAGWPRPEAILTDCCLWLDLLNEPAPGQLLPFRLTTRSHPFGFRPDSESGKLTLRDRREAYQAFEALHNSEAQPDLKYTQPFLPRSSLPVHMSFLIRYWCANRDDPEAFTSGVLKALQTIHRAQKKGTSEDDNPWKDVVVWQSLDEDSKSKVGERIAKLAESLTRLFDMQIPIIRLDNTFFTDEDGERNNGSGDNPPLELLFKRIGTGGSPLSPGDYAYSVIKNREPKTYEFVENLHAKSKLAKVLTPADLVLSAMRLAAAELSTHGDPVDPGVGDISRLMRNKEIMDKLLPLIEGGAESKVAAYLQAVYDTIRFRGGHDIGLPDQALGLLDKQLIQVLLRLAQLGYLDPEGRQLLRDDVIRLVMFWLVAMHSPKSSKDKASRLAYQLTSDTSDNRFIKAIYDIICKENAGHHLPSPDDLEAVKGSAFSAQDASQVRGWERFEAPRDGVDSALIRFYKSWWFQRNILLWCQRQMVQGKFGKDNLGVEVGEGAPYDYDHILPQAHWGNWTGAKNEARLLDFSAPGGHLVIGNSIGNIRIVDLSKNRSDGDDSPRKKLKLAEDNENTRQLRADSLVSKGQVKDWKIASGNENEPRKWDLKRALAFERAVEERTFDLYRRYYNELDFEQWEQ